jgi:uncharacterized protein
MGAKSKAGDADEGAEGPLRLCVVSRAHRPPEELIRFVVGPDGALVPDLARRLPGRGVWVDATRDAVAAAVRQKAFSRGLKRQVALPDDLPGLIERLMAKRLADAVSIANKAGLLVAGFTRVEELLAGGQAAVLVHAADAAADGAAKLDRQFKALQGPERALAATVRELTSAELSLAIGRANVVHAAASGGGASQRIVEEAGRLRRYRSGAARTETDSNTGRA